MIRDSNTIQVRGSAVDYAASTYAHAARWEKSLKIAAWAWHNGLTPDHIAACTDADFGRLCRAAGVNPPRPGSHDTRTLVLAHLVVKAYWAAAHPTHPDARRDHATPEQVAALTHSRRKTG
jgi:predicted HD phosphohydrolase